MLYDPANDVSVVLFSNLLDFAHIGAEAAVLFDIVTQARAILGY
jgi:hypothetical protein